MRNNFPERFKSLRTESGLLLSDLARKFNKSRSAIGYWESGKSSPNLDDLVKLCEIFKCTPNDLILDPEVLHNLVEDPAQSYGNAERDLEYFRREITQLQREINTTRAYNALLEKQLEEQVEKDSNEISKKSG